MRRERTRDIHLVDEYLLMTNDFGRTALIVQNAYHTLLAEQCLLPTSVFGASQEDRRSSVTLW